MISVDSLLYKIDQRLNKLATNDHQAISIEDKLLILNDSQIQLILNKVSPSNAYKIGLDGFKKRYQDLQNLIENPEDHKTIPVLSDSILNKYVVKTSVLPNFMFYIDSYSIADKEECLNRVIYSNADLVKHADITLLLRDSNFKPSFEYQESIVDISESEIHIYSDGTFTPKELYVSYLIYPPKIRYLDIEDFDGIPTASVDCELEAYLENELLDLAVSKLADFTENIPAAQSAALRKQTNE